MTPQEQFGPIDIYLFDQLLRGRIPPGARIFDAGCGGGRNIAYFLRDGSYRVWGVDPNPAAIAAVRALPGVRDPEADFRCEPLEAHSFPSTFADVVISSAVLHFAADDAQFRAMLEGAWRTVRRDGGVFFCRLASSIGIEGRVQPIEGRRCLLPDGSDRYLVDERLLLELTGELGAVLIDPIKTTVVQNQRSMTTWVLARR